VVSRETTTRPSAVQAGIQQDAMAYVELALEAQAWNAFFVTL
jgi:hypothetical protein